MKDGNIQIQIAILFFLPWGLIPYQTYMDIFFFFLDLHNVTRQKPMQKKMWHSKFQLIFIPCKYNPVNDSCIYSDPWKHSARNQRVNEKYIGWK